MRAKGVIFIGDSREDLRRFPKDARAIAGQALYHAQLGSKHINAKPLKGFPGAAVMEIVADREVTHTAPSIPCSSPTSSMSCIAFKRSQKEAPKRRNAMSRWFGAA